MDTVLSKHLKQQADIEDYAVVLQLACGARIGEIVQLANFEEVGGKPEHVKQVRKFCPQLSFLNFPSQISFLPIGWNLQAVG
jgi:hypothetical protein